MGLYTCLLVEDAKRNETAWSRKLKFGIKSRSVKKKQTCGMGDMRLRIRHEDFLRETKFLLVCPDATLLFLLAVTITITNLARF